MKFNAEKFETSYSIIGGEKNTSYKDELVQEVYMALNKLYKRCKDKEIHFYFHGIGSNPFLPAFVELNFNTIKKLNGQKLIIHKGQYDELEMSKEHTNIVFVFATNFNNDFSISVVDTIYSEFAHLYQEIPITAFIIDVPFKYKNDMYSFIRGRITSWLIENKLT